MNKTLLVVIVLVLLGGSAWYAYSQGWVGAPAPAASDTTLDQTTDANAAPQGKRPAYQWTFTDTETDANGTPHTEVSVTAGGTAHVVGTYAGTCQEVPAGETGVVNDMADEGETSRAQCWFAGSGEEIGIYEDGPTAVVKVGELGEGSEGETPFRGNFKTLITL